MKVRMRGVFAPKVLIPVLAVGAVGVGAIGVLSLLARRGEAAISMIPSDAVFAISFDNTPSPGQVALFNEIKGAMEESGLNDLIDEVLDDMDPKNRAMKRIRGHIKGSFAVGVWGDMTSGNPDVMVAIALNDADGAEGIVSDFTSVRFAGDLRYYEGGDGKMVVTFYKDYAVLASSVEVAKRALKVASGDERDLYDEPAFQEARRALPDDASLMIFVNGAALKKADKEAREFFGSLGLGASSWAAMSATLRVEGIQIDGYEPAAGRSKSFARAMTMMPPLTGASLARYPDGAVGVAGLSSPAALVEIVRQAFSEVPNMREQVDRGIRDMERETGFSYQKDWLPALRGELFAALYPPSNAKEEPAFILSIDNSNGGTPNELAEKLFVRVNAGEFDSANEKPRLREEHVGSLKVFVPEKPETEDFAFALASDQVMLISQRRLLEQTAEPAPGDTLQESEQFKEFRQGGDAQIRVHLDVYRLLEMLDRMGDLPDDINLKQVLSQREMTATWSYDGRAARSRLLIPINVPELIRVIGKEAKKHNSGKAA